MQVGREAESDRVESGRSLSDPRVLAQGHHREVSIPLQHRRQLCGSGRKCEYEVEIGRELALALPKVPGWMSNVRFSSNRAAGDRRSPISRLDTICGSR
jgi:hypothetical protein